MCDSDSISSGVAEIGRVQKDGMNASPVAMPPLSVKVAEVVLVEGQRGEGDSLRPVLQVFHPDGELLAEHDRIHEDPVYASYILRESLEQRKATKGPGRETNGSARAPALAPADAHIVIGVDLQKDGVRIQVFRRGKPDSTYMPMPDARLPAELILLLREIRRELSGRA